VTEPDRVTAFERVAEIADEAVDLLTGQFRDKPKTTAFLHSIMGSVQSLEDAIYELYQQGDLLLAEGAQLDQIGALLLRERGGLSDASYRVLLAGTILAHRSNGTGEDLLALCAALFADYGIEYTVTEYQRATVVIASYAPLTINLEAVEGTLLLGLFKQAKAAGVKLQLIDPYGSESNSFALAPGSDSVVDTARGFSDTSQTVGGFLDGVRS